MSLNCLIEFLQDAVANYVQISGWREPTVVDEFRFEKSRVDAMLVELAALKTMEGQNPPTNNLSDEIAFLESLLKHFKTTDYKHMTYAQIMIQDRIDKIRAKQRRK
jgi:hypothetical protein